MRMVLRSRRSVLPAQSSGVELQATPSRRSTRPQDRRNYAETDASEPEASQRRVMERRVAELEEAAEEDLKDCSVVLDRFGVDDRAFSKEPEDKEDMNRKGWKPVSRIPTFQKRPGGGSQTAELPAPRKEAPVHASQPSDEEALSQPLVRVPAISFVSPHGSSSVEAAAASGQTPLIAAPKSKSLSESNQGLDMIASPRPPLRPEQDMSKPSRTEAAVTPDDLQRSLPKQSILGQKGDEEHPGITLTPSGDTQWPEETADSAEVDPVEGIMDEKPPWETESVEAAGLRGSRSSSDAECEDDLEKETSEGEDSEDAEEHQESLDTQTEIPDPEVQKPGIEVSIFTAAPQKTATWKPDKSTKRSTCSCFTLMLLLLLGGFGLHTWNYGLPTSVAQLAAQLELHRLEGLGLLPEPCSVDCRVQLVESVPVGLYSSSPPARPSIADSWLRLLGKANSSVHIAAFYFTLRDGDIESSPHSDSQGRKVFEQLKLLEPKGVKLQVAVNAPQTSTRDTTELTATGAQIREVNLSAVTGGIVHTKLWVVDQKHLYLGSANMDWRSLSQVKEVGLSVEDCSCLAKDAFRIFGVYWSIGGAESGSLPPFWPARLSALSSADKPLHLNFNGVPAQVYLSSSPPQISARGRSDDLATILSVISDAQRFIHISVMDYLPFTEFTEPVRFWPDIDSSLRAAACTRGVQVRLMVSCWEHSSASMFVFLQSLLVLSRPPLKCDVNVKIFRVPSTEEQKKIPYARVNHAKYMVTDRVLYIGTSNWSENYFTHTAGVGVVVNQTGSAVHHAKQTLRSQAEELFLRDWSSDYAGALPTDDEDVCPRGRSQ